MKKITLILSILILIWSCSRWDFDDPSDPVANLAPETHLALLGLDSIFVSIADTIEYIDSISGTVTYDTIWSYNLGDTADTSIIHGILPNAFLDTMTSRQHLNWWGEDPDGNVTGYYYKWNTDTGWTFTQAEEALFFVPIRQSFDVFSFFVKAIDNDSLVDPTPAVLTLPIRNSLPEVEFRYMSNPQLDDMDGDIAYTFPMRTFVWDMTDQDGIESITDVFYALDDTCDTCWIRLDAGTSSIMLIDIEPGSHVFYVKIRDIAGAESAIIQFPDPANIYEPDYWEVKPAIGNVLVVDDFDQDSQNNALQWLSALMDTLVGDTGYSVWEVGKRLPYSQKDVTESLNYFDHVIWNSAYTGPEVYGDADISIFNYVLGGGNFFIAVAEVKDTSFAWFPIDSLFSIVKKNGELTSNRLLSSQLPNAPDLKTPDEQGIYVTLRGFENFEGAPNFHSLYRLPLPTTAYDNWEGTPTVAGVYQFQDPPTAGKAVLLTIPLHNAYNPVLDGNNNMYEFFDYIINDLFAND